MLKEPILFSTSVYEGVEEYSFKRFSERKERQKLFQKGDGPMVVEEKFNSVNLCIIVNLFSVAGRAQV